MQLEETAPLKFQSRDAVLTAAKEGSLRSTQQEGGGGGKVSGTRLHRQCILEQTQV